MPNWSDVLQELQDCKRVDALDFIRRKYLLELSKQSGRNTIAYYSGWLQKPGLKSTGIDDNDKNAFMATIHKLDRSKGLDLILHTPGGDLAATESLVDYLRCMFKTDIRAIIPQIAMSAGTMIACSCKVILMGNHSNLGPIDPQFNGIPAHGVLEEFNKAVEAIKLNPMSLPLWQTIIGKYHPTFIGECQKSVTWAEQIVSQWLATGMFADDTNAPTKIKKIVNELSDHVKTMSHSRHIPMSDLISFGLKIEDFKNVSKTFQDVALTVHHAYMHTFANSAAVKIVENQNGIAVVSQRQDRPV